MVRPAGKFRNSRRPRRKAAFYCDQNVPRVVGRLLKELGFSVIYASGEREAWSDIRQIIFATQTGRIFLTQDRDFRGTQFPPQRIQDSPGVVVIDAGDRSDAHYERLTRMVVRSVNKHSIAGRSYRVSQSGFFQNPGLA
jgi:predicted nuclease of predicted toxin-antitoxin system